MIDEPAGYTSADKRSAWRYTIEFGTGMALFLFLLLFLPGILPFEDGTPGAVVLAILPIVPVIWSAIAVTRFLLRLDERMRVILAQSFSIGFGVAMVTAVLVALVRGAGVDVAGAEWYGFLTGMISWGLSMPVIVHRAER